MNDTIYWKGFTARVKKISSDVVKKTYLFQFEWMVSREAKFLTQLNQYKCFPKLIAVGKNYIDMTYCGNRINSVKEYTEQSKNILSILKKEKITHRDVNPKNLLILNGVLYLIDWGWSLFDGEKDTPIKPPVQLGGGNYKYGVWDDALAMSKCQ